MRNATAANKQAQKNKVNVLMSKIKREPDFKCDYVKELGFMD